MLDLDFTKIIDITNWSLVIGITVAVIATVAMLERIRLNRYWNLGCTGAEWKQKFPTIPRERIRFFLNLFRKTAGSAKKRKLKFSPNDKIVDIYRALHSSKETADGSEVEKFVELVRQHYRIDLTRHWHENITLGEALERIVYAHPIQTVLAHA